MSLSLIRTWTLSSGGKWDWKVKGDIVQSISGVDYVTLHACDIGLCRMVCEGVVDPIPTKGCTLSQCDGYKTLLRIRNDVQREDLAPKAGKAASLFGNVQSKAPPPKVQRQTVSVLSMLRKNPQLIQMVVPAVGRFESRVVNVKRPSHPCDALVVELDAVIIEHIVEFIRGGGLDADIVQNKRKYASGVAKGVWPTSNGKYVVRLQSGEKKYRVVHTEDAAIHAQNVAAGMVADAGDEPNEVDGTDGEDEQG